jgi:hypothetical protein
LYACQPDLDQSGLGCQDPGPAQPTSERSNNLAERAGREPCAGDHDQVLTRRDRHLAQGFAQQALGPVATDCNPDLAPGDHRRPRRSNGIRLGGDQQHEQRMGEGLALTPDTLYVFCRPESVHLQNSQTGGPAIFCKSARPPCIRFPSAIKTGV